jgi:hypothetical protein
VVLVQRVVDGRDLPLAEGVVEGVVYLAHRQSKPCGRSAVDGDVGFQPIVLLVAVDLRQLRNRLQFGEYFWRPGEQLVSVVILQRELVLRVGGATADADVLHRLQKQRRTWNVGDVAPDTRDHLVGGRGAAA